MHRFYRVVKQIQENLGNAIWIHIDRGVRGLLIFCHYMNVLPLQFGAANGETLLKQFVDVATFGEFHRRLAKGEQLLNKTVQPIDLFDNNLRILVNFILCIRGIAADSFSRYGRYGVMSVRCRRHGCGVLEKLRP